MTRVPMSLSLPKDVACRVYWTPEPGGETAVLDVREPRDPFEVINLGWRRMGIEPNDNAWNEMMKRRAWAAEVARLREDPQTAVRIDGGATPSDRESPEQQASTSTPARSRAVGAPKISPPRMPAAETSGDDGGQPRSSNLGPTASSSSRGESAGGMNEASRFVEQAMGEAHRAEPNASSGVRDTSLAAYRALEWSGKLGEQQRKVVDVFLAAPERKLSRQEIARESGLSINATCGRVAELMAKPFEVLVEDGKKDCSVTKNRVNALRLARGHATVEVIALIAALGLAIYFCLWIIERTF